MTETDVTVEILAALNSIPGVFAYKHYSGGKFGKTGVHDIICCFRGKFVSIEVKKPSVKLEYRGKQEEFAFNVKRSGGTTFLVNSVNPVLEYITREVSSI